MRWARSSACRSIYDSTDLRLLYLRIPVAVVENHRVCGCQIDSQAACPRRKKKHKLRAVLRIEAVDLFFAIHRLCASINSTVLEASDIAVILPIRIDPPRRNLQNIQNPTHLTEQENARSFFLQSLQQLVQQYHFPAILDSHSAASSTVITCSPIGSSERSSTPSNK